MSIGSAAEFRRFVKLQRVPLFKLPHDKTNNLGTASRENSDHPG